MTATLNLPGNESKFSNSETIRKRPPFVLVLIGLCLLALIQQGRAQEKYLVSTDDGLLSLYDLTTNSFIEAAKGSLGGGVPVPGPNSRLAFDLSGAYLSVIDLTINRETNRLLRDILPSSSWPPNATLTPDGRYLLITLIGPSDNYSVAPFLYVIDASRLSIVKKVNLGSAFQYAPGPLVALTEKAYVLPAYGSPTDNGAVVDLTTFSVSSFPFPSLTLLRAVLMPDSSAIVAYGYEYSDRKSHLVLISTASDMVVNDIAQTQNYSSNALAISPPGTDSSKVFAYITSYLNQNSAMAIDLRANSPTFGMVLPDSAVALDMATVVDHDMAVNSDGSRLIVAGLSYPDTPNVDIIDTAKMLNDPQDAIIARVTVGSSGVGAVGVCTGNFSTIPPGTAPTVTGVSGDITNDMPRQISVTGTNFQSGALVRIGSMDPLQADVINSSTLNVTVPANAPAGRDLDIIVTNPQTNDPPDQRNQSGLLAGQFNILPNPKYHPTNQIATVSLDNSLSIYSITQQSMANVPIQAYSLAPAFNIDGKELYINSEAPFDSPVSAVIPVDLKTNQASSPIQLCLNYFTCGVSNLAVASRDPSTGNPVVDVIWIDNEFSNLYLSIIDSNSASPTFNTIIKTYDLHDTTSDVSAMAASPDGKFCYVWNVDESALDVIDILNGQLTSISSNVLGVFFYQSQIGISPDGKFLLLAASRGPQSTIRVFSLTNPTQPRRVYEIVPIPIPKRGFPYLLNYQVVGNRLYATDLAGTVVVFNFKDDFRELGYYVSQSNDFWGGFTISPDGAYFYATDPINDQVLVFDASRLPYGKDALLTAIRAPYYPYTMDVSPVAPPQKAVASQQRAIATIGGR